MMAAESGIEGWRVNPFLEVDELQATAHHIEMLDRKLRALTVAKHEAWAQMLHRAAKLYEAGELDAVDLLAMREEMRATYGDGMLRVWNNTMPVHFGAIRHMVERRDRYAPNGPNGSWFGPMDVAERTRPDERVAVVYVLFDSANEPIYVGSTDMFIHRIRKHRAEKPEAVSWVAYPCRDREHAYEMEDRLIKQHKLRLNVRNGR